MSAEPSLVQIHEATGGVWVLRMANPPVNALTPSFVGALGDALEEVVHAPARAVVLSSAVPAFYAAGADIKTMVDVDREGFVTYGRMVRAVVERLANLGVPTVAAIEGSALGGGLEMTLACSLRVAGRAAKLGLPEARLGLIPSAGATQRLPRVVGKGRALDLLLTGRTLDPEEGSAIGLVDRVVDEGQAEAAAIDLAGRMASFSVPAQRALLELVDASFDVSLEEGLALEVSRVEALLGGPDAREGMRAFVDKRRPRFE